MRNTSHNLFYVVWEYFRKSTALSIVSGGLESLIKDIDLRSHIFLYI